jgi:hypothetical protein
MLKIARLIGMFASLGTLGLYIVLVFFNPYSAGQLTWPIGLMMLLAGVGFMVAWKTSPYLMLIVFLASFIPIGLYMLGTPGIFKWIGVFNLLYGLASLSLIAEAWVVKWRRKTHSS